MTLEEAVAWCDRQRTTVKFDPANNLVLITAHRGPQLCHGTGSTFVEAVAACDASLTRILEARERAKVD